VTSYYRIWYTFTDYHPCILCRSYTIFWLFINLASFIRTSIQWGSPTKIWISLALAILFGWKTGNGGSEKSPYQWTTFQFGGFGRSI